MKLLADFVYERQAESAAKSTRLTGAFFELDMAHLYFELGMTSEAKVSLMNGYRVFNGYLPENDNDPIDTDVDAANNLYWEIRDKVEAQEF